MGSGTAPKTRAFRRLFPVAVAVAGLSGLLACAPVGYARAFFPESAGMVPVDGVLFVEDGTSPADADALRRTVAAKVTYATAGHTVEQWFAAAGTPGLWALIARLKDGAAFDGAFSAPS